MKDLEETHQKIIFLEMELNTMGKDSLLLTNEYMKKKEEYSQYRALHKKISEMYEANKKVIKLSQIAFNKFINLALTRVVEHFEIVLSLRKIEGSLDIDPEAKNIVINMFNNISTSCASGGERTFATVALIIALWKNMNLPFYSIDEYDVYMDNVNRVATTDLLMAVIENRKNQYIFLTPQDVSHIKSAPNVKIVQLKEPRS